MQYLYSEKSFARGLFDAAKSKLLKPFPDAPSMPRHWLDAMNYGSSFTPFNNRVKFRSMRGISLRIASVPICTHDPAVICRLPQAANHAEPEAPPQPDDQAAARSALEPDVNTSPYGNAEPEQEQPACGKPACGKPDVRPTASQENSSRQPPSRMSTPVLSTLLGLTVAITVGIIIGNNNTFKLKVADSQRSNDIGTEALPATANAASSHAPRLTLDSTPPRSPSSVAESTLRPEKPQYRQEKTSTRRMAVKQPAKKKLHASARSARPSSASKESRTSAPASPTATTRKAPARAATGIATAGVKPHLKPEPLARLGTLYARCEKLRGLLRQERCRWQVCGGKWGKQGCPAYQHKSMSEMGFGQLPPSSSARTPDGS